MLECLFNIIHVYEIESLLTYDT